MEGNAICEYYIRNMIHAMLCHAQHTALVLSVVGEKVPLTTFANLHIFLSMLMIYKYISFRMYEDVCDMRK